MNRVQFQPGEGLLILEAQDGLMQFLISCCKVILHDIPESTLISEAYPHQPEPTLKSERDFSGFDSLSIMALEAPYRLPANMSLARMEALLQAAVSAKEDHIWALREDPGYFLDHVVRTSDHRQEKITDTLGHQHPIFQHHREHVFWHRVVGNVVANAYMSLAIYDELLQQVRQLQILQRKYAAQIKSDDALPSEYRTALLRFRHYLLQGIKGPLLNLRHHTVASPQLRRFFVREPPIDPDSPMIRVTSRAVRKDNIQQQLLWLLQTLWEDSDNLFLCKLTTVVDELQRLIDAEEQAAELVSDYIEDIIGDLSILSVCLSELESYQPWANSFEDHFEEERENIMQDFAVTTKSWSGFLNILGKPGQTRLEELGRPAVKRFDYPVSRRRTKENVEQMRHAEANLDAFWSRLDQKTLDLRETAVGRLLSEPRTLQRTPEWTPLSRGQERQQVEDLTTTMSEYYLNLRQEDDSRELAQPQRKEKTKTRGKPAMQQQPVENNAPIEADPPPKPIEVDARALKVFRTLFFNPSATATPGEVAWNDFLHALVSALGFTAEKLYGSKWQFTPPTSASWHGAATDRPIQFHESHLGKIPFQVARRHGRRLQKTYGWSLDSFVLRGGKD